MSSVADPVGNPVTDVSGRAPNFVNNVLEVELSMFSVVIAVVPVLSIMRLVRCVMVMVQLQRFA